MGTTTAAFAQNTIGDPPAGECGEGVHAGNVESGQGTAAATGGSPRRGTLVLLARHAERDDFADTGAWSLQWWQKHTQGRPWDAPLSALGVQQATVLGELIKSKLADEHVDDGRIAVCTSPFLRCAQTAAVALPIFSTGNTEFNVDTGLSEHLLAAWFEPKIGHGPDFMLSCEQLVAQFGISTPGTPEYAPLSHADYPETMEDINVRGQRIASSIVAWSKGANAPAAIILFTHGGVLLSIVQALFSLTDADDLRMPHQGFGALTTVKINSSSDHPKPTLSVNRLAELPRLLTPDQHWFDGQEPTWRSTLLPHINARKAAAHGEFSALELGSWEGASAAWILANACDASPLSRLTCIDHFDKLRTTAGAARSVKFSFNVRITGLWPRVDPIVDFTVAALSRLITEKREWDMVYVDASHESADTLLDAMLAWKGLRQNGIMVFDDYEWPTYPVDSPSHPKAGIDAFISVHSHELEVIHRGYQIMVKKLTPPRFNC
jgi:broad specificity phosphatase PhoE/predicted O-methyltransferase YrrM